MTAAAPILLFRISIPTRVEPGCNPTATVSDRAWPKYSVRQAAAVGGSDHAPAVHWRTMLDHRGRRLRVALSLLELRPAPADAALAALRSWLDSWTGIGAVTDGMAHQGYD